MVRMLLVSLLILLVSAGQVYAGKEDCTVSKSDFEKLWKSSEAVYICEFKSYKFVSSTNTPVATYRYFQILKGSPFGSSMRVRYDLDQTSSKMKRKQIAKQMPSKNSKWILFFKTLMRSNGQMITADGSKGRVKFTGKNLDNLMLVIKADTN